MMFGIFVGLLSEAYDELGARYKVPVYCLSRPLNLLCEESIEALVPPGKYPSDSSYGGNNVHAAMC